MFSSVQSDINIETIHPYHTSIVQSVSEFPFSPQIYLFILYVMLICGNMYLNSTSIKSSYISKSLKKKIII